MPLLRRRKNREYRRERERAFEKITGVKKRFWKSHSGYERSIINKVPILLAARRQKMLSEAEKIIKSQPGISADEARQKLNIFSKILEQQQKSAQEGQYPYTLMPNLVTISPENLRSNLRGQKFNFGTARVSRKIAGIEPTDRAVADATTRLLEDWKLMWNPKKQEQQAKTLREKDASYEKPGFNPPGTKKGFEETVSRFGQIGTGTPPWRR